MATVFAGHGQKSLTCEVTPAGVTFLHVNNGGEQVLITLTPEEKARLADALFRPGFTTEIVTY